MRMLLQVQFPLEPFNTAVRDGSAGPKIQKILDAIKPEAVYFTEQNGHRGGTLVVNVTGCFLIGAILTSITQKTTPNPNWQLFLVVGLLGGYTTFSGFAWETFMSARNGSPWVGLLNVISSVILGYFAVWLGVISVKSR